MTNRCLAPRFLVNNNMKPVEQKENQLREFLFIYYAQKTLIIRTAMLVMLGVVAVAFLWPPVYSAEGRFLVKGKRLERSPETLEETTLRFDPVNKEDLHSEVQIITSDEVILAAVSRLEEDGDVYRPQPGLDQQGFVAQVRVMVQEWLDNLPMLKAEKLPQTGIDPITAKRVIQIRSAIKLQVIPSSKVIALKVQWSDPVLARQVAQAVMDSYLLQRRQVLDPTQMGDFFSSQVNNYLLELSRKKADALSLIRSREAPNPEREITNNLDLRRLLEEQLEQLGQRRLQAAADLHQLTQALSNPSHQYFAFIDNLTIRELAARLQELMLEADRINGLFLPHTSEARGINGQVERADALLKQEVTNLKEEKSAELTMLDANVQRLHDRISELNQRNLTLKELEMELAEISRESRLLEFSFETFFKRREEASISNQDNASSLSSHVVMLTRARAFTAPDFPNKQVLLPFGVVVSLLVGFSIGFMNEFFDHTFKRPEDVGRYAGLPVIFSIADKGGQGRLKVHASRTSPKMTVTTAILASIVGLGLLFVGVMGFGVKSLAMSGGERTDSNTDTNMALLASCSACPTPSTLSKRAKEAALSSPSPDERFASGDELRQFPRPSTRISDLSLTLTMSWDSDISRTAAAVSAPTAP
jgi:uncharacterized protein involved in exopolysaccharide biosynthesis